MDERYTNGEGERLEMLTNKWQAWMLADRQQGPECGVEAVENVIQSFWPLGNEISETSLKVLANQHGYLLLDGRLLHTGYQPLLNAFGVAATWQSFDHGTLIAALRQHRRVIALVDGYYLDASRYAPRSGHAIMLTSVIFDERQQFVLGYSGIDTNYEKQELWWPSDAVERATQMYAPAPLLITDKPAHKSRRCGPWVQSSGRK